MAENENFSALGKKIFFLHPSAFTQNQVIAELTQEEFEVYIIKDENKCRQALCKYPDSILFASVNEGMKEKAWEDLISAIKQDVETASVQIGIIASANSDELKRKYTEQLKVQCGFTVIKSDYIAATKQLTSILNDVSAKGRRKFIRMIMGQESNTTINLPMNGTFVNGTLKDISVVGFSCVFSEDPGLTKNGLFGDIQLRLQSNLLKAEGIVFGSRTDGTDKVYVILFSQRVDPDVRTRIRKYIQANLQNRLDQELK
jgi:hypothetical protein